MELRSINFSKYLLHFLELGIRPDGRVLNAARPLSINVGSISSADGSSLLRLGNTLVACGVKLELVSSLDSQSGVLVCNVECGSNCSPKAASGPPSSEVQVLTEQVQLLLIDFVDLGLLNLENSEFVWVVNVDVVCLCHEGNLLDACSLAAMAALRNVQVPCLITETHPPKLKLQSNGAKLPLNATPTFTVSFALFNGWSLLDPSLEEEECAHGHITIALHSDGIITQLIHTGHNVSEHEIIRLSKLAMKRVISLNELVQK